MQQLSHSIRTKQCSYCLRQLRWSTTQAETASKPPASAKEASTSKAAWIPPPLPRPLGIRHTERSVPLSKQEKREDRIQKNAATRKLLFVTTSECLSFQLTYFVLLNIELENSIKGTLEILQMYKRLEGKLGLHQRLLLGLM